MLGSQHVNRIDSPAGQRILRDAFADLIHDPGDVVSTLSLFFLLPLNTGKIWRLLPEMKLFTSVKNLSRNHVGVLSLVAPKFAAEKT